MTSKHYVAITPPPSTLFPGQNFIGMFQRVWVSVPTYCHICIFISWADIYAGTRHSAHARPSCTRVKLAPLSHPLTSHRIMSFIGFIANPSVNYAFPSVFQCRLDRLHPIGPYLPPRPSPESFRQLPNFRPAHTRPLCARERRGRDYL